MIENRDTDPCPGSAPPARIRYRHLRLPNGGAVTIAQEGVVAACAFCSPRDSFSRRTGRQIATERLVDGNGVMVDEWHIPGAPWWLQALLKSVPDAPSWFKPPTLVPVFEPRFPF